MCVYALLDAAPLGRAAAVMRDGRHVGDCRYLETGRLQRANCLLAPGARTLDEDLDLAHAVLHRPARGAVSRHRGGVGRALARALKTGHAGAAPRNHATGGIGDGDDGVVEARLNVNVSKRNVLAFAAPSLGLALAFGHAWWVTPLLLSPDANGALGAATLAGIGLGALAADGQIAPVAQ